MNTTSNIKNMTEVEINNHVNEINDILDKNTEEVLDVMKKDVENTINNLLHSMVDVELNIDLGSNYSHLVFENDSFHHIDIEHQYDINYKNDDWKAEWKFKINVASCGSFTLLDNAKDKDEKNIVRYYMTIGKILTNKELINKMNGILKDFVDDVKKNREEMRHYNSELRNLRNELNTRKMQNEIDENASKALSEEAKDLYTIIDTNSKYPTNAIYRKQEVTIVKAPASRKNISYFYISDSCKIVKCSTLKSL